MKELPIRKGAAFYCTCSLYLGFTVRQTWLFSSPLSFQPHFTTRASQPASSHLPWHERSAWTTDIGWEREKKTVILCNEHMLSASHMKQQSGDINQGKLNIQLCFLFWGFKIALCDISDHITLVHFWLMACFSLQEAIRQWSDDARCMCFQLGVNSLRMGPFLFSMELTNALVWMAVNPCSHLLERLKPDEWIHPPWPRPPSDWVEHGRWLLSIHNLTKP